MNFPYPHPDSDRRRNLASPDGVRHAEVGELVDDGCPDVALGHLPVKLAGEESITQLLEPIHHVFGNAAAMVAGFFLPARPPLGFDLGQKGIPWMVVPPGHGIMAWRNRRLGFPLANGGMRPFGIVGPSAETWPTSPSTWANRSGKTSLSCQSAVVTSIPMMSLAVSSTAK